MILISNLTLNIKDGSTIASTSIYGADKKTYINIGSGNVFKLEWGTPTLTNDDTVDRYKLVVKRHDTTLNVYYDIFDKNIGLVNEYYVDSPMLPALPEQYMLSVYLVAYGKQGSVVTSNVINPYISKGSGTYVKVQPENYAQPIMKRALALAKTIVELADADGDALLDSEQRALFAFTIDNFLSWSEAALTDREGVLLLDAEGKKLLADDVRTLPSIDGWQVIQESYTKDAAGTWRTNDITYEVLVDNDGEIIEVLNDEQSYEPLYIL